MYVQFDSRYASKKLIKHVHRQRCTSSVGSRATVNSTANASTNTPRHSGNGGHAGQRDHYGRRKMNSRCATARRPFSRCSLRRPCLLLKGTPGRNSRRTSHVRISLARPNKLARIHLALVMRNRQLLLEDPGRTGILPCPVLRSGGHIHRRRSFGLGLRRAAFPQERSASSRLTATLSGGIGTSTPSTG